MSRVEERMVVTDKGKTEGDTSGTRGLVIRNGESSANVRIDKCREGFQVGRMQQTRRSRNGTVVIIDGDPVKQEETLKKAKEKITLEELGIRNVKFRKSRKGATIIELDGNSDNDKVDRLIEKLIEIGKNTEEVSIRRPFRVTKIKIRGVSSSVSRNKVVRALQSKWGKTLSKHCLENVTVSSPRAFWGGTLTI